MGSFLKSEPQPARPLSVGSVQTAGRTDILPCILCNDIADSAQCRTPGRGGRPLDDLDAVDDLHRNAFGSPKKNRFSPDKMNSGQEPITTGYYNK